MLKSNIFNDIYICISTKTLDQSFLLNDKKDFIGPNLVIVPVISLCSLAACFLPFLQHLYPENDGDQINGDLQQIFLVQYFLNHYIYLLLHNRILEYHQDLVVGDLGDIDIIVPFSFPLLCVVRNIRDGWKPIYTYPSR